MEGNHKQLDLLDFFFLFGTFKCCLFPSQAQRTLPFVQEPLLMDKPGRQHLNDNF